jgi:hypothetical protein
MDINWVLMGITAVLTIFIIVIRLSEVVKYRNNVKVFYEKNKDVEVLFNNKRNIYVFIVLAFVVFTISLFVEGSMVERLSMAVIFAVLCFSEAFSSWMNSRMFSSDKEFLYGMVYDRYRSIKTYKAKGKRSTIILTLKNDEYIVPNNVAELVQNKVKGIKNSKK